MMSSIKFNRENYFEGNLGSSNGERDAKGWIMFWTTVVPSKIRVFLWRLAHQSLPTADVLENYNMAMSTRCHFCGGPNSWKHSLIECNMANSVWSLEDELMVEHMITCGETDARNWLFHMMETMPHDQFTRMIVTLWAIWTVRRKAIHEEVFQSPLSIHGFIDSFLRELGALAKPMVKKQTTSPGVRILPRWRPPPEYCY
jgi:hypothetical protein